MSSSLNEVLAAVQKSFDFRKEATIGDIPFELSILTLNEEQKISALSADGKDPMQYMTELRKYLLSYAIKKINKEAIPDTMKNIVDGKEVSEERAIYLKSFLDKMPSSLVEALFDVYVDLKEESDKTLRGSMKYSWFKTPEQREIEAKEQEKKIEKETVEATNIDLNLKPLPKTEEPEEEPKA